MSYLCIRTRAGGTQQRVERDGVGWYLNGLLVATNRVVTPAGWSLAHECMSLKDVLLNIVEITVCDTKAEVCNFSKTSKTWSYHA